MTATAPTGATVTLAVEITPDPDGVHCGECGWKPIIRYSRSFHCTLHFDNCPDGKRCPACLAAERRWREAQAAKGGLVWHGEGDGEPEPNRNLVVHVKGGMMIERYCMAELEEDGTLYVQNNGLQKTTMGYVVRWAYLPTPKIDEPGKE